jgi:hypothetical protein
VRPAVRAASLAMFVGALVAAALGAPPGTPSAAAAPSASSSSATSVPAPPASAPAPSGADAVILAGAASRPITPEVGGSAAPVPLAGFSEARLAEGILDELEARALILEAGGGAATLVALDLYGLARGDVVRMEEAIKARVPGAASAGILIACTRTHAAPDATGQFLGPGASVDSVWLARVTAAAADAVEEAWRIRQPARLSFASTRLPRLLSDGRRPSRIDDGAWLLRVESAAGHVGIAALAVFGASPETLGRTQRQISAEYPGAVRRALEDAFGGVGIFLVGASGGWMRPVAPAAQPAAAGAPPSGLPAQTPSYGEAVARALVVAWSGRRDAPNAAAPDSTRGVLRLRSRPVEVPLDNAALREAIATGRRRARLAPSGAIESAVAVLSVTAGGGPLFDLACVPGEVYPELVDGGIQEPQDPAADRHGEPAERALRSMLRAPVRMVAGACGDDLGDIIPISEWDEKAPFAYGLAAAPRGEETSPGPRTAPTLWAAFADLLR